jgi:CBS domain-containing protein
MKVEDVMTRDVKTVSPATSLRQVAAALAGLQVSGLPVVDGDRVVGVISEADILIKERGETPSRGGLLGLLLDDRSEVEAKLHATTAGEAMTAPAITIGPRSTITEAAARMIDEGVNRLPVVDDGGKLVGIITRADLVQAFVRTDGEIEREIREDVVLGTLWIPPDRVNVLVERGQVTLSGEVETKIDAELLPKFVGRVAGVISVDSKLTWESDEDRRGPPPPSADR